MSLQCTDTPSHEYLYSSALLLTRRALKAAKSSQTRHESFHAAIAILYGLLGEPRFAESNNSIGARLLLCEILIRHTKSQHLAVPVYAEAMVRPDLSQRDRLRFKLLEIEYMVGIGNLQEARRVYSQCRPQLAEAGFEDLAAVFALMSLQFMPASSETVNSVESVGNPVLASMLRFSLAHEKDAPVVNSMNSPVQPLGFTGAGEIITMELCKTLILISPNGFLPLETTTLLQLLSGLDPDAWEGGRLGLSLGDVAVEMNWYQSSEVLQLCYLVLALAHIPLDNPDFANTFAWLSELSNSLQEAPASGQFQPVFAFYKTMLFHYTNKPDMRSLSLAELRTRADGEHAKALLSYAEAVIDQSNGATESAATKYQSLLQHEDLGIALAAVLNLLAIKPLDIKTNRRLDELATGDIEDQQVKKIHLLLRVLGMKSEMDMDEYQKSLVALFEAPDSGALHDTIIRTLGKFVHNASHESRINNLREAADAFRQLNRADWATYADREAARLAV